MKLYLYRLSLSERPLGPLFETVEAEEEIPTRKDVLSAALRVEFDYEPRAGIKMRHVHLQEDDGIFAGVLARWKSESRPNDARDPFAEGEEHFWQRAAYFFNSNDDQQVLGIEHNRGISSDHRTIVSGLVAALNESGRIPHYRVDAFSVNEAGDFWQAVTNHPHPIVSMSFEFVRPNPPNTTKLTEAAMKDLYEDTNASTMRQSFDSEDGLDLTSEALKSRQAVAESGAGEAAAKGAQGWKYSTKNKVKVSEVSNIFRPIGQAIDGLADVFRGILRR